MNETHEALEQTEPDPVESLTTKQRQLLELIDAYQQTTGEACSGHYLARRLSIDPTTVRGHLAALYRKGWLKSSGTPAEIKDRKYLIMPR